MNKFLKKVKNIVDNKIKKNYYININNLTVYAGGENNMTKNSLKSFRVKFGFTQKDIADKLGISTTAYSFKETGKNQFTLKEAKEIANLFNTTIDNVFYS